MAEPRLSKSIQGVKEGGVNGEQVVNYQAAAMRRKDDIEVSASYDRTSAGRRTVNWK